MDIKAYIITVLIGWSLLLFGLFGICGFKWREFKQMFNDFIN